MTLLIVKILITALAVFLAIFIGGLLLCSKLTDWLFPKPQITTLGDVLPFHAIYKDIIMAKDGSCCQILKIGGYDAGSRTADEIKAIIEKKRYWLDKMSENGATFKILTIRREQQHNLEAGEVPEILKDIHNAWMTEFKKTYHNTHYLLLTVCPKSKNPFLNALKKDIPQANTGLLKEVVTLCQDMLSDFKLEVVKNGENASMDEWSDLMSLLYELSTGKRETLRPNTENVADYLGTHIRFVDKSELIEYDHCVGKIVSLNEWSNMVSCEMLREIQLLSCRLIIIQMFETNGKTSALAKLEYQRRQKQMPLPNPHVEGEYQVAIETVQGDVASLYSYQLSILILAKTEDEVNEYVSQVKRILISYGKSPAIETSAKEWIWRCQFPCVDGMVRKTYPMSKNLAYLINFEAEPTGLDKCDWGDGAIRPFKTVSGSAYSLQLHVDDKKAALAHSVVVAPTSSGKTTLFQHLIGGALRHSDLRAFIFDRNNGTKVFTQSVGGNYIDFNDDVVPINPFFCEENKINIAFVRDFLLLLAGFDPSKEKDLTEEEIQASEEASLIAEQIFFLPKEQRILSKCFQDVARKDSKLARGLRMWALDISMSRWFNGQKVDAAGHYKAFDALDLSSSRLASFEMTEIQKNPKTSAAFTTYLMHRIRSLSREAYPHMIFIDETQPMLADPVFAKYVDTLLKEHRKLRGSISVCFQDVNAVSSVILEQCQTRFLFPNSSANKEAYAKFELTDFEWDYIKGFNRISRELKHSVLVKKPHESVILNVDMSPLGNLLQLYSSSSEHVKIAKELQQQWGMKDWVVKYLSL